MLYCSQASMDMAYDAEVTSDHHLPSPLLSFLGMQLLDLDFVLQMENVRSALAPCSPPESKLNN